MLPTRPATETQEGLRAAFCSYYDQWMPRVWAWLHVRLEDGGQARALSEAVLRAALAEGIPSDTDTDTDTEAGRLLVMCSQAISEGEDGPRQA